MRNVKVAATQAKLGHDSEANVNHIVDLIKQAADQGANIILPQELFATPYFCKDQDSKWFDAAMPFENNPIIEQMSALAKELNVVIPTSFFERSNNSFFNSLAMIDADGTVLGLYRKSHIPDGPGYQEKFYFSPGDTGFKVWNTQFGRIGVGICWDQWFPEAARVMALKGAELLFYPTAIGSEPPDPTWDSKNHWQRAMQGHAASNLIPVIASNRTGHEQGDTCEIAFYGSSFITDITGDIVAELNRDEEGVIVHEFNLDEAQQTRSSWGIFRDRRPDLYQQLTTLDGKDQS